MIPAMDAVTTHPPSPAISATRAIALACTLGLIVLGLGWELAWAPTGRGTLAVKVLPLAFAIPGLLKWRLYTCRWLSLLVWLYVAEGLVRLRASPAPVPLLCAIEVVLATALFIACAAQVRWRLAAGEAAAPAGRAE
jgi:uncharacterized membrane protein